MRNCVMKMYVKVIYGLSLTFVFFMLIFFHVHEKSDEYIARDEAECRILTDYEVTSYANESAPVGITQEYKWTLSDVPKRGGAVTFYVFHQEVEIYLGDELVYSLMSGKDNLCSKTTGYQWAKAYLYPEDEGKEIRILIHPIYSTSIRNDLTIYYGNYDTICAAIFDKSLFILILGVVLIILGLAFITFVLINLKNHEIDTDIAMLGVFFCFCRLMENIGHAIRSAYFQSFYDLVNAHHCFPCNDAPVISFLYPQPVCPEQAQILGFAVHDMRRSAYRHCCPSVDRHCRFTADAPAVSYHDSRVHSIDCNNLPFGNTPYHVFFKSAHHSYLLSALSARNAYRYDRVLLFRQFGQHGIRSAGVFDLCHIDGICICEKCNSID